MTAKAMPASYNPTPPPGVHDEQTKRWLKAEGLSETTPLGITRAGRFRHIVVGINGRLDTLCRMFRPGTGLLKASRIEDEPLPLCSGCLRTLGAEVLRAKHAMRNQPEKEID